MAKMSTMRERAVSSAPNGEVWQQTQQRGTLARILHFFRRRKRGWFVGMVILEVIYVFVSVPLRIGFLFDPYATKDWSSGWTVELTVFTVLDVLADTAGFASLMDIFAAQRREQAAVAADAIGAIGARRQRSTQGIKPGHNTSLLNGVRDSLKVAWSLNTIIPKNHRHHGIQRPVLLEMISMIPLELLALAFGPNSLHLLRVLKLLRLYRVPGCMRELKQMYTGSSIVQVLEYTGNAVLLNTVTLGLVACHWIACGYMAIAHLECGIDFMLCSKAYTVLTTIPGAGEHGVPKGIAGVSPTGSGSGYTCWAIEDYLVGTNVGRQYGRAVYWASRSVVTAGFYDVAATTNIETVYAIFAQVVGAIFSTAVLATFLFIFRYRNARMQEFMAHVDSAKEYMQVRHFPENVREGVLGYYKNTWATHHALHHDEVIERLPGHLKVSLYSVLKAKRIQDVAFLSKESIEFINTLALRVEYCVYSPKDWIIEKLPDGIVLEAEFEPILEEFTRDRCLRDAGLHGNCSWTLYDAYGQIGTTFKIQDPEHSIYTVKMAYMRSIYWAIVALTTVGYGDIVAFSTYESYFAALWVFIGGIINYGVVGAMSNIISNLTASSRHHSEKMNTVNVTLGHFRISESVRVRIRQFYHQQLYVQKVTSEVQLLDGLPTQLRHRISSILHAESVRKVPLFIDAQNERLLYELTGLFRRQLFQRGDPFFAEGTLCEEMYVVVNGRANIFSKRVGAVPVGALSAGDCFGVCELLLRKSFNTTVIAASVVDASVITYSAFVAKIESHFPAEMESLRLQATQQHIFDTLTLEAVIDNIKSRSTLAKFTEKCTSMFEEKENWGQQRNKMRLRLYWDLIVLALDVYNSFQVTFRIGFLAHPSSGTRLFLVISDFVGDALLIADIYLKLYYFECEEVGLMNLISREERSMTYTGHELRNDMLSSLPLYYVGSSFLAMSLCRLPRLLRLHQIPGMIDSLIMRLQQRFSAGGNISAYLSPIKLVLILLFTGHLAACVFYLICHTDHNHKNWTHHDPIVVMEHESVGVLYLRAFYWALTTLTLVGSREIVPLGMPGTLWATFTCLCCAFIVGHIVGELSELFLEMDATKKELKERESHFDQFAKDHDLPASIYTRVQHYLKFQHHYLKGLDIYATFSDLSPNLRVQLMMDLHGNTLQNLCIAPFLNQTQINGLAMRLKSELYIPGDTIIVEGDLGHKLYIVKGGMGMVLWKSTGTAVATLTAGSLFGEVAFFLRGQRRIASVQATTCSELLVLGRRSWEELLASSPREEAESTERALIQWVQYCLKGYNIMTVEIVKDIKSGDSGASKKPKNIEELRELNAMKTQDDEDNAPVVDPLRYVSASALEERKVRQLLRKTAGYGGSRTKVGAAGTPSTLTIIYHWIRDNVLPSGRKAAKLGRVYADFSTENGRTEADLTPPSGRRLFAWHTPRNATAGLSKMKSFKNGTAVQINPVSRSMREYYRDEQLVEMEEECWRRYKVSLFMADAFTGEVIKQSPAVTPASPQLLMQPQQIQTNAAPISQNTSRNDEDNAPTASKAAKKIRVSRKTFCGAMLPGASPQRATRSLVTTDGMRFLANYESRNRPSERGLRQKRRPRGSIHGHELHQSFGIANLPSGAARAHRRQRKLKRSQSLPLFDRHFAHMIRDELQDSNAKEFESKLNLGFELLQRCRQPEFSSLFRVYLSWLKHKRRWRQWYEHQTERFTWLNSFSSTHSDSEKPAISRTNSFFHDSGHDRTTSSTSLRDGASSSTSSKAEDFVNLLSRCYRLWEWVVVFVGLFYAVTIPFFVCFASDLKTFHEDHEDEVALAHWERIVIGIDLVCMADLFLKHSAFRRVLVLSDGGSTDVPTATQQPVAPPPLTSMSSTRTLTLPTAPQQSSHKRKNWWQQYVNTHLWLDVVTSLPFDILLYVPPLSTSTMADHRWFYLSLFQLNKVPRIVESIEASERLTQFLAADLNLPIGESRLHFIRTVCVYVLSGHWIGCLWFRLGLHAYDIYGDSWLSTYKMLAVDEFEELSEIPTSRRYLRSLHFAIGSITTVFYGDVVSMNAVETVVEIAFIVVCILIFGVLVGAQGEMIEANYKHKMLFEQNLMELYHFLKNNDVPRDVRQRLRLYYTNTWLKYHGHDDLEGVRGLSTLLVEDIAQYTLRGFANRVSILKSCDESFLRSLLTCLKHIICSSSEAVVRKGDVDRSMYFIAKGKVLVQGPGFELVKHEGDFFGELSLLYGIPRSATCSSLGVSLLYVLEWETYERLLADYPEYREQNRREWVIVSTVLKTGESRFRSIIDIVARMEKANWVLVDEIIRKAKSLK
ncbi:hypothetical protein PC121_g7981 [Phytophthora cactorum]|nr:hypothetical protein PC121_g7981 [Phytophthora cactorum]